MQNTYMLMFWICTDCGGAEVIRVLNFDEDEEQDDNENGKKNDSKLVARDKDIIIIGKF